MFKNNKIFFTTFFVFASISIASCSLKETQSGVKSREASSVKDTLAGKEDSTGKEGAVVKDTSEYLDKDIIEENKEKEDVNSVYEVTYGTFEEPVTSIRANGVFYGFEPVIVDIPDISDEVIILKDASNAAYNRDVKKGDVLATVEIQSDSIEMVEAETELKRLHASLEKDKLEYEKERNDKIKENKKIENDYEAKAGRILIEKDAIEWANKVRNYEYDIQLAQKKVDQLKLKANSTSIISPVDGFIGYNEKPYKADDVIKNGDTLCNIITLQDDIILLDNESVAFSYGMNFDYNISVLGSEDIKFKSKVISGSQDILYGNLESVAACVKIDLSDIPEMDEEIRIGDGKIAGSISNMENVLIVPKRAVKLEKDIPYVTIVNDDGSFVKAAFVPGGENTHYYWVYDGIEEGTKICLY